jgi:hypothetical protein
MVQWSIENGDAQNDYFSDPTFDGSNFQTEPAKFLKKDDQWRAGQTVAYFLTQHA